MVAFATTKQLFSKDDTFSYKESLGETVFTIEEEHVTLKEITYYILVAETNFNAASQMYNKNDMGRFWNLLLRKTYVRSLVKKSVLNSCIRDNIYYREAIKNGYTLDEEAHKEIENQAVEEMVKLTDGQRDYTEYSKSDMIQVLTKIYYAKQYVSDLMQQGYTEDELDIEGIQYQSVLADYEIETNEELWKNITLGQITINNDYN